VGTGYHDWHIELDGGGAMLLRKVVLSVLFIFGGLLANAAIRGTASNTFNASSYAVAWPTGTVTGDVAVISIFQGCGATLPADWINLISPDSGSTFGTGTFYGLLMYKVLSAADISAGSVTVTLGCGYNGIAQIVTLVGSGYGVREVDFSQGVDPVSSTNPQSGDLVFYFAQSRSSASAPTCSLGTLQQSAADGSAANGSLYYQALTASGQLSPIFTYSGGTGVQMILVLVPTGGSGGSGGTISPTNGVFAN